MSGNRGNLRMTSARHSVVQGHLRCLTVHFHLYFSGGQVSRGVVLNFPALLKSPDPTSSLTNPVLQHSSTNTLAQRCTVGESRGRTSFAVRDVSCRSAPQL